MEVQEDSARPDNCLSANSEQRAFAEALGRSASVSLSHLDWDEVTAHLMLAWQTSSVSGRLDWRAVEPIAYEAWSVTVDRRSSVETA